MLTFVSWKNYGRTGLTVLKYWQFWHIWYWSIVKPQNFKLNMSLSWPTDKSSPLRRPKSLITNSKYILTSRLQCDWDNYRNINEIFDFILISNRFTRIILYVLSVVMFRETIQGEYSKGRCAADHGSNARWARCYAWSCGSDVSSGNAELKSTSEWRRSLWHDIFETGASETSASNFLLCQCFQDAEDMFWKRETNAETCMQRTECWPIKVERLERLKRWDFQSGHL